jgi:uncharacterized membrane protein YhhN
MRALIPISIVLSCMYFALFAVRSAPATPLSVLLKVAAIGVLVVAAAVAKPISKLLIAALAFSALGDFLLEVIHLASLGPETLFLLGLIAFLIAHLFYIALFVTTRRRTTVAVSRKIACAVTVVVAAVSLSTLWPGLAEMRIPVLAYTAVLTAMVVTAQISRFSSTVAIGAISFLASDTMLAMSIFGHAFAGSRPLVWITYYAAQLTITWGVVSSRKSLSAVA